MKELIGLFIVASLTFLPTCHLAFFSFFFFFSQYYCRHCGNHFCAKCCAQKVPKSLFGATGNSLIFLFCYKTWNNFCCILTMFWGIILLFFQENSSWIQQIWNCFDINKKMKLTDVNCMKTVLFDIMISFRKCPTLVKLCCLCLFVLVTFS